MKLTLRPPFYVTILPDGTWEVECTSYSTHHVVEPSPLTTEELASLDEEDIEAILK